MKSLSFWYSRPRPTPVLLTSACLALLLGACHKPRFRSEPQKNADSREPDAAACSPSNCADTTAATSVASSSDGSFPDSPSTPTDDAAGASSSDFSDAAAHTAVADAGVSTAPTTGSTNSASERGDASTNDDELSRDLTTTVGSSGSSHASDAGDGGAHDVDAGDAGDGTTTKDASSGHDATVTDPPLTCETTTLLAGVVRDFDEGHPDMEPCEEEGVDCSSERGLVAASLGDDDKPVFVPMARADDSTIQSEVTFGQWFRDVEGVNVAIPFDLQLTTRPRMVLFDSNNPPAGSPPGFSEDPKGFFPIDEWNTTERPHNYHFTYEVHSHIAFERGDNLTIRGDDDIFVFINRQLVVDLGGIHLPQEAIVEFDDLAEELGLQAGTVYEFHLFFAERHVEQSNLRLSTDGTFYDCRRE